MGAGRGLAEAILASEVCAPVLLLCWLCCWPDESSDTSSTGKCPRKPVLLGGDKKSRKESGSRRSHDLFGRRFASSAVSLHLPSTSGYTKEPLSAHRSHEEIRPRRKSHLEIIDDDSHYHSAPSVIDEVIHRRDWDRSTKELHIPLNPDIDEVCKSDSSSPERCKTDSNNSETNSAEDIPATRKCKKHHTNIKSSKNKNKSLKEATVTDIKDVDATEVESRISPSKFYIGEQESNELSNDGRTLQSQHQETEVVETNETANDLRTKDLKQSLNESIRCKERPKVSNSVFANEQDDIGAISLAVDEIDDFDRSGAMHHYESRLSLLPCISRASMYPPSSVEAVGYEGGACYLAERGAVAALRARAGAGPASQPRPGRHASDGDILAPAHRPQSGAFSESDLELELECDERPPPYCEVEALAAGDLELLVLTEKKETAI